MRQQSLKMCLFTFLLWAGAKASGSGRVSRSLRELGLHSDQGQKLGLLVSPGCPHPPIHWLGKRAEGLEAQLVQGAVGAGERG